jgi:thymidylate synthase
MNSPDTTWRATIHTLISKGWVSTPRGQECMEILSHQTTIDMNHPILLSECRKLSYRFMAGEAHWILTGDNRVNEYVRQLAPYSDNGETMFGAYGPKFVQQYGYVIRTLMADWESRQAVITFWRECPGPSKDIPCTIALQFLIRDKKLHLHVTMRSSDIWLGWPYDVFSFSMIAKFIQLALQSEIRFPSDTPLKLGYLTITAGSQHLYARDYEKASGAAMDSRLIGSISSICIDNVISPDDLLTYLDCARRAIDPLNYLTHGKT